VAARHVARVGSTENAACARRHRFGDQRIDGCPGRRAAQEQAVSVAIAQEISTLSTPEPLVAAGSYATPSMMTVPLWSHRTRIGEHEQRRLAARHDNRGDARLGGWRGHCRAAAAIGEAAVQTLDVVVLVGDRRAGAGLRSQRAVRRQRSAPTRWSPARWRCRHRRQVDRHCRCPAWSS
jgi:hypothetical protein